MRIRLFRDSDAAAIARLHKNTVRSINAKDYTAAQVAAWTRKSNARHARETAKSCVRFVAIEDDIVVGFGEYAMNELRGLFVHKNYVGQGIGSMLLVRLECHAKLHKIKKFTCASTKTAKEFYLSKGYHIVARKYHNMQNRRLFVYEMEKVL